MFLCRLFSVCLCSDVIILNQNQSLSQLDASQNLFVGNGCYSGAVEQIVIEGATKFAGCSFCSNGHQHTVQTIARRNIEAGHGPNHPGQCHVILRNGRRIVCESTNFVEAPSLGSQAECCAWEESKHSMSACDEMSNAKLCVCLHTPAERQFVKRIESAKAFPLPIPVLVISALPV